MKDDIRACSLEEHAALLSAIVESSPDLIWTCDADMRVTFCNAAIEGLLGYGAEEVIGRSPIDLVHPDDREMALRVVSQAIEAKVGWRGIRARLVCKDGLIRHAESSAKPLLDGQGDLRGFSGVNRDITDRVLAEQELSEHQKRLEMIMDHSSDGIDVVVVDAETGKHRLVMCNDRYVEMSGYSRRQLMAADDVRQLERVVSVSADYMDRKAQGLSRGGTSSWIRPDGKENYYEWVACPITIDGKCHVVGIDREITDRVIADRGLREHQRRLEMILKYSFDGISICTVDMQTGNRKLVMCNDRFVEMSGRSRDELLAVADIGQFVDLDEQAPSLLESIVRGKAACGLGSWKRPDGEENHHDWTAVPLEIAGRTHLVGIDRDVTENVRCQRQMQEAVAAAGESPVAPEFEPVSQKAPETKTPRESPDSESGAIIDYSDPEALTKAILHYEILGKPLALRETLNQTWVS